MKQRNVQKRLRSLLTLVLLLLPIISLAVYADSSPTISFSFVYNGSDEVRTVTATKTDLGESSVGAGAVNVQLAQLTAGKVKIWVNDKDGLTITGTSYVTGTGKYILYYDMSRISSKNGEMNVTLYGKGENNVQMIAGYFQP